MADSNIQGLLMRISHIYFTRIFSQLSELGLHPGQVHLLKFLLENDGTEQREISRKLQVKPPTVTVSIKRLQAAGLLTKKADPRDQRLYRVYLTDKGRQVSEQTKHIIKTQEELMLQGFSDSELCLLRRFLEQMCGNLEQTE